MRPLTLSLPALALTIAAGTLLQVPLGAQERRPAPDARRAPVRERTRERVDEDVIVDRGDGWQRMRITRPGDANRAVLGISLGEGDDRGVRVVGVTDDGPAAKAGIQEGDRIAAIDGTTLTVAREDADDAELRDAGARRLQRALASLTPGAEVTLAVLRGGDRRTVRVKTVAGSSLASAGSVSIYGAPGRTFVWNDSGMRRELEGRMRGVRDMRDSARAQAERRPALGLAIQASGSVRDTLGLFVGRITSGGPAEKAGIVEGERIAAINGVDVRVPREDVTDDLAAGARGSRFTRELRKAKPGDDVTLRIWGEGRYRTTTVKVGRAADVFRDDGAMSFRFGGDEGMLLPSRVPMPPMPPMGPMGPRMPMELRGRLDAPPMPDAPRAPRAPRIYRLDDRATSPSAPRVIRLRRIDA